MTEYFNQKKDPSIFFIMIIRYHKPTVSLLKSQTDLSKIFLELFNDIFLYSKP